MKFTHTYENGSGQIDPVRLELVYKKYIEKINELTLMEERQFAKNNEGGLIEETFETGGTSG
jgi:hypothetical protein